jgi:hypothetical protein
VYFFLAGQQLPARCCVVGGPASLTPRLPSPDRGFEDRAVRVGFRSSGFPNNYIPRIPAWHGHGYIDTLGSMRLCSPLLLFNLMSSFVSKSSGDLARLCRTRPHQSGQRPDWSLAFSSTHETSYSRTQNRSLGTGLRP